MPERSRILAGGRASEIVALDDRRILRRTRTPHDFSDEASIMRYARSAGFPVPEVFEVRDDGLVMERIAGPTMAADLARHPWRAGAHARLLADLHHRLHELGPPPQAPPRYGATGPADVLLHGDLHPLNVLLSPAGAVVIDWTNAGRGPAGADVADAWLVLAVARMPGSLPARAAAAPVRHWFLRRFVTAAGREEARRYLTLAAARRAQDPHVSPQEKAAMRRIADRAGRE